MILMSGFHLGQVPFKKVLIHGLVRAKDGRKCSKSLNNGIDPLEIIEKYGNKTLRELKEFIYQTDEFKRTEFGKPILLFSYIFFKYFLAHKSVYEP